MWSRRCTTPDRHRGSDSRSRPRLSRVRARTPTRIPHRPPIRRTPAQWFRSGPPGERRSRAAGPATPARRGRRRSGTPSTVRTGTRHDRIRVRTTAHPGPRDAVSGSEHEVAVRAVQNRSGADVERCAGQEQRADARIRCVGRRRGGSRTPGYAGSQEQDHRGCPRDGRAGGRDHRIIMLRSSRSGRRISATGRRVSCVAEAAAAPTRCRRDRRSTRSAPTPGPAPR